MENIAYCGLYCGDCPNHSGVIADLARDLRKELRKYRFDKTAESLSQISFFTDFEHYDSCYTVLGAMVRMRCSRTCRNGGANPGCKIRICAKKKGFEGCWECPEFEFCNKLDFLNTNHGVAHRKNLRLIKKSGPEAFKIGTRYWFKTK
ncbi:MAG TPA: DUF3795 domain-containing protein [Prolixibacteraceae bacterium]|nr:DUF3795 domain-containing protein [Prolixibacteraceae bacterium]